MAGHEYLSDTEVVALAEYVQGLCQTASLGVTAVGKREVVSFARP